MTPAPASGSSGTLSTALEPLYREYLRRLDEMVGRLPPGAALTEQTARGEDGKPALGQAGLPLRFDVADARDGHTWEVHGAHPDEPAVGEVRVGGLVVRLQPGNWEELAVVCRFSREPGQQEIEDLADLLRGFVTLAWHGGFATERAAEDRWLRRAHGVRVELRGLEVWAVLDLGTCPPAAVEALCSALAGFSEDRAPLSSIQIGGTP